jgi:uncharacterized SAM-binding protein YcdF (DUF218 family)
MTVHERPGWRGASRAPGADYSGRARAARRVRRLLARAIVALAAIALALGFLDFAAKVPIGPAPATPAAGGIIVLTGGPDRVADGLRLLAQGRGERLLISGVNNATSREQIVRAAAASRKLVDCCVDLGYAALNTYGNANEAREWVRKHRIGRSLIVVTSDFHMPRALVELSRTLPHLDLIAHPVPSGSGTRRERWADGDFVRHVTLEYFKYLLAHARIRLSRPG